MSEAVILAGGKSRRMGADKALLKLGDETLLTRTIRLLQESGHTRITIVGREADLQNVHFLPDSLPDAGPLAALATALAQAEGPLLVVPCDLPLLSVEALRWLGTQETGELGVVAVTPDGMPQPLFARYTPALLPTLQQALERGDRSFKPLLASGLLRLAPLPAALASHLESANDPESWQRLTQSPERPKPSYQPVYLDLRGRLVVVVGGGYVAGEKLSVLFESGAVLRVVSPELSPELQRWHAEGRFEWHPKRWEPTDQAEAFVAIGATNDKTVNRAVFQEADRQGRLGNSVDDPKFCNFILSAVARSGPMQVAISSAGCSPALAQRVRRRIVEEILTPELGELASFLGSWRPRVKAALSTFEAKQQFWEAVLDSEIPALLAAGNLDEANRRMELRVACPFQAERGACDERFCLSGGCRAGRP
ncbi:NTP transferase domain-containing protein [Armatimonas rosea]|uniref:precorrin-2 dehydrogenase n=1 Tax=Armatimonas rosea TaxID=685828 RepID=A0A7W9SMW0_ARMRO|nr:NTP transferase domain-containing protein [Armatimonas rosea]MBB6049565.1 siroheme synthase-like protein [Armatimonas rosea]